jgi:hypothetical protein
MWRHDVPEGGVRTMSDREEAKPGGEEQPADDDKNKRAGKNWTLALLKVGPGGKPSEADVDRFMEELGFGKKPD